MGIGQFGCSRSLSFFFLFLLPFIIFGFCSHPLALVHSPICLLKVWGDSYGRGYWLQSEPQCPFQRKTPSEIRPSTSRFHFKFLHPPITSTPIFSFQDKWFLSPRPFTYRMSCKNTDLMDNRLTHLNTCFTTPRSVERSLRSADRRGLLKTPRQIGIEDWRPERLIPIGSRHPKRIARHGFFLIFTRTV